METRTDRLDRMINTGNLLRRAWGDGQDRACLLSALAPEVAAEGDRTACPASVMPLWLAELTPSIDDLGSEEAWPEMVRRYAALAHRWHVLDAPAWSRLDYKARVIALRIARGATSAEWSSAARAAARAAYVAAAAAAHSAAAAAADAATYAALAAAAHSATAAATWDRFTAELLDAIEVEIELAERGAPTAGIPIEDAMPPTGIPIEGVMLVEKEVSRG